MITYRYEIYRLCDNIKSKLKTPLAVFDNNDDAKAFIEQWEYEHRWMTINGRPVHWSVNHCQTLVYMNP